MIIQHTTTAIQNATTTKTKTKTETGPSNSSKTNNLIARWVKIQTGNTHKRVLMVYKLDIFNEVLFNTYQIDKNFKSLAIPNVVKYVEKFS